MTVSPSATPRRPSGYDLGMAGHTKLCARCGLLKPRLTFFGRAWCDQCERADAAERGAAKIREVNKARYEERKAKGQCQRCSQPARPRMALCAACARKNSEAAKARAGRQA